jgi:hypothetical protein
MVLPNKLLLDELTKVLSNKLLLVYELTKVLPNKLLLA